MSQPPPQSNQGGGPPRRSSRDGGSSSPERIAIENVELLEADHQRRQYFQQQQRQQHHHQQQQQHQNQHPPPPPPNNPNFVYGTMPPPIYGMPVPHAFYGSTGQQSHPQLYPPPPPPQPPAYVQAAQNRRTRSAQLPANYKDAEAAAMYPTEYQPLMGMPPPQTAPPPPPPPRGVYGSGSLADAAAVAMRMESTSSAGALTLDDIERSFNQVVSQQYHEHHHRAMSTSDIPPPAGEAAAAAPQKPTSRGPSPRPGGHHRRAGSLGNSLPPTAPAMGRSPGSVRGRKRADSSASRSRANSGSFLGGGGGGSTGGRGHRRSWSRASSTDLSVASAASMVSAVSDISKSAFFGGVTEGGQVQMHYPTERVRIIMQKSLPRGHVFMHPIDPAAYEAYHAAAEESQLLQWEHVDGVEDFNPHKGLACHCHCGNCAGCTGKTQLLPAQHFVINVPDDIYQRLLDEICASQEMPCGLFYCGHHEDVSTPSIGIPIMIVVTLFLLMGGVAYVTAS